MLKPETMKAIAIPVVVALLTGVSSSYLGVSLTLAVMETRIKYMERDIGSFKELEVALDSLLINQAAQDQQMQDIKRRLNQLEAKIR